MDGCESGIYIILNCKTGKFYIGSAINLRRRFQKHKLELQNGNHHCSYLQNAWKKYGEKSFQFYCIEFCIPDLLLNKEQKWINKYWKHKNLYNLCRYAGSRKGQKFPEETLKKMSLAKKGKPGRKITEKEKIKISNSLKGHTVTNETREKMSIAAKQRYSSPK